MFSSPCLTCRHLMGAVNVLRGRAPSPLGSDGRMTTTMMIKATRHRRATISRPRTWPSARLPHRRPRTRPSARRQRAPTSEPPASKAVIKNSKALK